MIFQLIHCDSMWFNVIWPTINLTRFDLALMIQFDFTDSILFDPVHILLQSSLDRFPL